MISLLQDILCAIEGLAEAIVKVLVIMVNAAIVGIGAFIGVLVALLPEIPEAPNFSESGPLTFLNFFVPLGPDLAIVASLVTMFGVFMLVRLALNWMRAL